MQERGIVATLRSRPPGHLLVAVGVAGGVVVLDQLTTSAAEAHLRGPVHLIGPLGLALRYNSGSAFSLFTGDAPVLVAVGLVLVAALSWLCWRARSTIVAVASGLVLGGAIGNLSDRVFRGHHGDVVDFITLSHWPTFNVADFCITVGILVLIVSYWRRAESAHGGAAEGHRSGEPGSADRPRTGSDP